LSDTAVAAVSSVIFRMFPFLFVKMQKITDSSPSVIKKLMNVAVYFLIVAAAAVGGFVLVLSIVAIVDQSLHIPILRTIGIKFVCCIAMGVGALPSVLLIHKVFDKWGLFKRRK
jgi:hypothetical protein